jgi:O-antigen/teichoic acid export membrane protein
MNNPVLQKIRSCTILVGEGAFDLGVNLIVMVMVERSLGVAGLGIFSYLISLMVFAGFFSELGISGYLEREIAITPSAKDREKIIENTSRAILLTSLVAAALFLAFAISGVTLTRVDERAAAYLIISITLLFRNFNRVRIAVLQGSGAYDTAATLKTYKRLFLLGAVFVLLQWNLPPSYLMLGYLAAEIGLTFKLHKKMRLPKIRILLKGCHHVRRIMEQSLGFFLTDEAMDTIFYMDFLILGFFVTSQDLGIYAEASILARIFLLIPISIKPVFRGHYCGLASQNRLVDAAASIRISAAILFFSSLSAGIVYSSLFSRYYTGRI